MADFTIPSTLISGAAPATSYDLPNYVDELFDLMPQVTPFFTAIGGENGGREVSSRDFVWEIEDGEPAVVDAQRFENATVTGDLVPRQPVHNVVEIHQEAVKMGYTAQAVTGAIAADAPQATLGTVLGDQPVMDPMQHQINKKIGKIKRDLELSFLQGTFEQGEATNTVSERRTRGMIQAITTHDVDYTVGTYATIKAALNDLLLNMVAPATEAATAQMENMVIILNPVHRATLSGEYSNDGALAPRDRTVGGVAIDTLVTDHATLGIMSNRYMPATDIILVDMNYVRPVFLPTPNKGVFFAEPLAKTGAFDAVQLYGEIGLEYGPETFHGKISNWT